MNIGKIEFKNNVFLAPMAGITDLAFRIICKEFGAELTYTEMISAKGLSYNDKKTFSLLNSEGEQGWRAVQIFGSDPFVLSESAKRLEDTADIIDINMGCPAGKIIRNGEGSALTKDPMLVGEIINKVSSAVKIPVTVKIRKGFDKEHINAPYIAHIAEESGAAAITVHGRLASDMYSGVADREIIKKVKEEVKIPVIGNGDIFSAKDAKTMFEETGCDGIMVARGALGNPFIFDEILNPEFKKPTVEEKIKMAIKHIDLMIQIKGEKIGIPESRKHIQWYVKGMRGASTIKNAANNAKTYAEIKEILSYILTSKENI